MFTLQELEKDPNARVARAHLILGIKNDEDPQNSTWKARMVGDGHAVRTGTWGPSFRQVVF